jgi:hypothetical protein
MSGDDADEVVRGAQRILYHTQWRIWEELALEQLAAACWVAVALKQPFPSGWFDSAEAAARGLARACGKDHGRCP